MSPAEKYGRGVPELSAETLTQVRAAGRTLVNSGAKLDSASVQPPAQKYGAPVPRNDMGRSLSQKPPGRSL